MGTRVLAQRYEILEKIGEGGMAVVFKAKDRKLDRYVALKILRPEYTTDDSFIESFRRESQLVAGIVDPNIIQVYDVGQQGNIYYIVMELVEGETLSEIISREGSLDAKTTVSYGRQIAMALTTAHHNNLIHRDIKPHNIMVTYDGVAKLTDFGIAKRVSNNTLVGDEKEAVMGSIHYFSPEQARGNKVDERSDIYSLGIVMYEMITGQVPYDGENAVEVAVKHMNGKMTPPSHLVPDMPQDLEDIILKATAKNADNRYKNAEEMITDLNFVKFSRKSDYALEMDDRAAHPERYEETDALSSEEEKGTAANSRMAAAQIQNEKKAGRRRILIALGAVLAVILLFFGIFRLIMGGNPENSTVKVPKVEGTTYEEAKILLESMELKIVIETEVVNDNEAVGTIVRQSPSEGASAKKGQTVKVHITRKSTAPSVPPLLNLDLNGATARLQQYGYILGEVTQDYSDTVEKGKVMACNPSVGSALEKGSKINLVISKGPDPSSASKFAIDVRGKSLEEAIALIERMGCSVSKNIRYTEDASVAPGCVCGQSPAYNEKVSQGTEFTLTVRAASGEEQEAVITVDFTPFEGDIFSVTIIVTDDYKNTKDGTTQYSKVPVKREDLGENNCCSFKVTGTGKGTVIVIVDNNTPMKYAVNFSDGSSVIQYYSDDNFTFELL